MSLDHPPRFCGAEAATGPSCPLDRQSADLPSDRSGLPTAHAEPPPRDAPLPLSPADPLHPALHPISERRSSPHPGCRVAGACRRPFAPRVSCGLHSAASRLFHSAGGGAASASTATASCYRRAVVSAWPRGHTFLATGRCCVSSSSFFLFWVTSPSSHAATPLVRFFLLLFFPPHPSVTLDDPPPRSLSSNL